ncbi:MAG: hypothetical protein ACXACK_17565 [Candidatus Hodarchaeales archaeon]|jgi:metal-dependent hydrolase (beta-lactamase superfamily II)
MSIQKLEIQILVDNIAGSFSGGTLGEYGFSALSKVQFSDSELIILFDTGPSPVAFLNNIKKLEVAYRRIKRGDYFDEKTNPRDLSSSNCFT